MMEFVNQSPRKGFPMPPFDPATDIRVIREPPVHLVGRQIVDDGEIDRFLADHGVSCKTDAGIAGAELTDFAGRVSYMNFAKPGPGGK
jgi:thymidylate synthase (FAD)